VAKALLSKAADGKTNVHTPVALTELGAVGTEA